MVRDPDYRTYKTVRILLYLMTLKMSRLCQAEISQITNSDDHDILVIKLQGLCVNM